MVTIAALGYVTYDPQLKLSQKGRTYSSFVLAVQQGYGETAHTMYLQCWAFDTQAELLSRMRIRKGSCLQISGDLDDVKYWSEEGIAAKKQRGDWEDYGRPRAVEMELFLQEYRKGEKGEIRPVDYMRNLGITKSTYYRYRDFLRAKISC